MKYPKFAVAINNEDKRAYFFNYRSKTLKQGLFVVYLTNNTDEAIRLTRKINNKLDEEYKRESIPHLPFIVP